MVGIEYDPNRSANIALIEYADGTRNYILAPVGLTDGMKVVAGADRAEPQVGNSMLIKHIPAGLNLHNIEMVPGKGGQICRSAGSYARLTNKEGKWATLVMPSGENPPGIDELPSHDRSGRQHRPPARASGQGRPQALAGSPPACPAVWR